MHLKVEMGNRPSHPDPKYFFPDPETKRELLMKISEEKYRPMPASLKKRLLGKKFKHVSPYKDMGKESNGTVKDIGDPENAAEKITGLGKNKLNTVVESESGKKFQRELQSESQGSSVSLEEHIKIPRNVKKTKSVGWPEEENQSVQEPVYMSSERVHYPLIPPRSPTLTNRQYSLIDLKTDAKKSQFTLNLEEKLRRTALEGFDSSLSKFKEFNYKVVKPIKYESEEFMNSFEGTKERKDPENGSLRESVQYCAHNCQILGLCSLKRPDIFPSAKPYVESFFKGDAIKTCHNRDSCNCDICTLAFLTEMAPPTEYPEDQLLEVNGPKRTMISGNNLSMKRFENSVKEKIKLVDGSNGNRSIEVCVSKNTTSDDSFSDVELLPCFTSEEDCTNRRIKRMFQENKVEDNHEEILNNVKCQYDKAFDKSVASPRKMNHTSKSNHSTNRFSKKKIRPLRSESRKSSSSFLATSVSSSLSTIISYKRVREIFQMITQSNKPRKKPKKNIEEFRKMEELGLGEVKNNRWYPNSSKTFSIWRGINLNTQGVQVEFKRFSKASQSPF